MSRLMSTVIGGLIILVGVLGLAWALQRRMMYFPLGDVSAPGSVGLRNVEAVTFTTGDGLVLNGWFLPSLRSPPWFTVLVFNGNAGNRAYRAPLAAALRSQRLAVLLFDYRGFGDNPGTPTEAGLMADGRAALAHLLGRADVDGTRLVLFGESLGTAIAVQIAGEHPPAALILRSPFVSMIELGRFHYPFLPVRWLLRDRFASIDRVRSLRCPLLVVAGEGDRIVPVSQSRRLYEAAPAPKTLVVLPGADHNDFELLAGDDMIQAIVRFLQRMDHAL
jgi:uncharacterized protein